MPRCCAAGRSLSNAGSRWGRSGAAIASAAAAGYGRPADQRRSTGMATTTGFTIAHRDDLERTGGWLLVRRTLGVSSFGMNLVEIEPGQRIPEHDETQRDQEEVFLVLSGQAAFVIEDEPHPA